MKHVNVLLAGGASRRFGEPKAFVKWKGRMFYECAKEALGEQTVIISRPEFIDRFQENGENEVYQDAEPFQGMGPLAGIYTAFKKTDGDLYTVLSCDTPLIQRRTMLEAQTSDDCRCGRGSPNFRRTSAAIDCDLPQTYHASSIRSAF